MRRPHSNGQISYSQFSGLHRDLIVQTLLPGDIAGLILILTKGLSCFVRKGSATAYLDFM